MLSLMRKLWENPPIKLMIENHTIIGTAQFTDFNSPAVITNAIEVDCDEFIQGLPDYGTVTFKTNRKGAKILQNNFAATNYTPMQIGAEITTNRTMTFQAYVSGFELKKSFFRPRYATLRIVGPIEYST